MIPGWASPVMLAAALCIALAGCTTDTSHEEENTMDHVEARSQLVTLLETAQNAIAGDWERSDAGAQTCTLAGGGEGASYGLNRIGPGVPVDSQQAIVDEVVAEWAQSDVVAVVTTKPEVSGVVVTQVRYPDSGVDPDGFFVQLWISDRATTVGGQSRCATGDAAAINAP